MEWKIKNGYVLTPFKVIKDGTVVIEDDKIIDVGKTSELDSKYPRYDVLDATNKIVMPGLINTHTHIAMSLLRGFADDLELMDWLQNRIWPIEAHLNGDDVYYGSLLSILEMIKAGITTFNDMYFFMDRVAQAVTESGVRGFLSWGMIELHDREKVEAVLKESLNFALKFNGAANGRIKTMLAPHALYSCSPDFVKKVRDIAIEKNLPIHIHLAESKDEVKNIDNMYNVGLEKKGMGSIEYANELGLFDAKVIGAHCIYLKDNEIKILAEKRVGVSHNPVSNMKIAAGIAPIPKMLEYGVNVGIGTDGPASNNSLDLIRDMKITALLHKVATLNPTVVPATEVVKMATIYGARAIFADDIGEIAVGKKADIITVNLKKPHLTPVHDVISLLVYSANGSDVNDVMVDGKLIMENRKVLTLKEEEVIEKAEKQAKALLDRAGVSS
ncbi:MAG: amidohydrolase [Candidatus Asgardarchaeia archaeon]